MKVVVNQWTPFFSELAGKLNSNGRRRLLNELIGSVYDVTILNFGPTGEHRPSEWEPLKFKYATEAHDGDTTPTLELTGSLKQGFYTESTSEYASLKNDVEYLKNHQFSIGRMHRPFIPVDEADENFTPYMEAIIFETVQRHFQI